MQGEADPLVVAHLLQFEATSPISQELIGEVSHCAKHELHLTEAVDFRFDRLGQ